MNPELQAKVLDFVEKNTDEGKNWRAVADVICFMLEKGSAIGIRDIRYDSEGVIIGIKGTEVRDGVLQIKEKKKPIKAIVVEDDTSNPLIDELRKSPRSPRRRTVVL